MMDAFSQPKMTYDPHSKSFSFSFDSKRPMNPPASARCVLHGRGASNKRGTTPFAPLPPWLTLTHPPTQTRARMFRERYQLVQQRVLRHELFTRPILGHDRQARPSPFFRVKLMNAVA